MTVLWAPGDTPGSAEEIREWAFSRVNAAVRAASRQPEGTLVLRTDRLSPVELAEQVLAAVDDRHV